MKSLMQRSGSVQFIVVVSLAFAVPLQAADSDLWVELQGPAAAMPGATPLISVLYGNAGPETAGSAVIDVYVPFGLPAPWPDLIGADFDALQASAATFDDQGNLVSTTDSLGNVPYLFIDDNYCEHFKFQLQGQTGAYVEGLDAGVEGSFTFTPTFPMEEIRTGEIEVTLPGPVTRRFLPASTSQETFQAGLYGTYTRGGCEPDNNGCTDLSYCFGARVSDAQVPNTAIELANDGSADPTFACNALQGFTPGNIALIERGSCQFGDKALNAETAGAVAMIMVNDLGCSDLPDSDVCAINMSSGDNGGQVTIPVVMISQVDGQPMIDALVGGQPVSASIGGDSRVAFSAGAWLHLATDNDPVDDDNSWMLITEYLPPELFFDDFETGDTTSWSATSP